MLVWTIVWVLYTTTFYKELINGHIFVCMKKHLDVTKYGTLFHMCKSGQFYPNPTWFILSRSAGRDVQRVGASMWKITTNARDIEMQDISNIWYGAGCDKHGILQCTKKMHMSTEMRRKQSIVLFMMMAVLTWTTMLATSNAINFYVSRAKFLTTLRSHLDVICSCYFWSKRFNMDVK